MTKPLSPRKTFINAVKNNDIDVVKELVESKKVVPSGYHNLALKEALDNYSYETAEYLLKQDKVIWDWDSIRDCLFYKNFEMLKILLRSDKANQIKETLAVTIMSEIFSREERTLHKKNFLEIIDIMGKNSFFKRILEKDFPEKYAKFIIKEKITQF